MMTKTILTPENMLDVTSNNLADYPEGTIIRPEDAGYLLPFSFEVTGCNSVTVTFYESQSAKNILWEGPIMYALYQELLAEIIKKRNDVTLAGKSDVCDHYSVKYSVKINCHTISEAVEKSLSLMDELHQPLDDAMYKCVDFMRKELGLNS